VSGIFINRGSSLANATLTSRTINDDVVLLTPKKSPAVIRKFPVA